MTTSPARVALVRCNSYDQNSVDEAVARGLSLLGNPQTFFQPGENLLLKPNLLGATLSQLSEPRS